MNWPPPQPRKKRLIVFNSNIESFTFSFQIRFWWEEEEEVEEDEGSAAQQIECEIFLIHSVWSEGGGDPALSLLNILIC